MGAQVLNDICLGLRPSWEESPSASTAVSDVIVRSSVPDRPHPWSSRSDGPTRALYMDLDVWTPNG